MFAINGLFLSQRQSGIQRFARQLVLSLDKICSKGEFVLVCPFDAKKMDLCNIETISYGKHSGIKWEQKECSKYLKKTKLVGINLLNTMPYSCPGIICIHDIAYAMHKEFFNSLRGKLSAKYHQIFYKRAIKSSFPIFTVSEFSKNEILSKYQKANPNNIYVLGNGWNHIVNVDERKSNIIEKYNLPKNEYFYTLGNIAANKNTKYVYELAKRNPNYTFVVSGAISKSSKQIFEHVDNVIELGYVLDEDIKALMLNAKAFIFPSIYEGFGIPPLEALSLNTKIIISNTSCLPEIFKSSAIYIDPYDYDVDLNALLDTKTFGREEVLKKYTWEACASKFYQIVMNYSNKE